MTTINTIEDLARILREQPTWAEALRSLLLTQELLDLPARFDRFVEIQQETNQLTARRRLNDGHLDGRMDGLSGQMESLGRQMDNLGGRMGNLEGARYERSVQNKALAYTQLGPLGMDAPHVALNQASLLDPQFNNTVSQALREGRVSREDFASLFDADLVISARDNRHAVIEVSITLDADDITRARERSTIMESVTGGTVTPMVITSRLDPAQSAQADREGVRVFVIPYP